MTQLVQVALAEDIAEAEELQTILNQAGIASELEPAGEHHPRATEDTPQKVLVAEDSLAAAQHAIEALTDPDDLVSHACVALRRPDVDARAATYDDLRPQ